MRMSEKVKHLLSRKALRYQVTSSEELSIGLVSPAKPVPAPGTEQTRIQGFTHGCLGHRQAVPRHRHVPSAQFRQGQVGSRLSGLTRASPNGGAIAEDGRGGDVA